MGIWKGAKGSWVQPTIKNLTRHEIFGGEAIFSSALRAIQRHWLGHHSEFFVIFSFSSLLNTKSGYATRT